MFRRLILDHWVGIFTLVAFITSASIYVSFFWRALRMRKAQVEALASLPLLDGEEGNQS